MEVKNTKYVVVGWTIVVLLLEGVLSQRASCPGSCVDLQECPALGELLQNPTNANVKKLQDVTCGFNGNVPRVCCPAPTTTPPPLVKLPRKCGQGGSNHKIHGGEEAPLGAYPWMALMGYKETGFDEVEFLCAGSVISERYILTAAHCVTPQLLAFKNLDVIRLGEWNLDTDVDCQVTRQGDSHCSEPVIDVTHEEIILHPQYNKRANFSDDIALIRLSRNLDLSGAWVHPVCMPTQGLSVPKLMNRQVDSVPGIAAGWGMTEKGTTSKILLHVELPLVNNSRCNEIYSGHTVPEQICMGGVKGKDSCGGDSGGPLVIRGPHGPPYLQVGIVSYGPSNCGTESVPGVYTDVTHYIDWIHSNLRP